MNQAPEVLKQTEETTGIVSETIERIRNPFLAGFVIAWSIINYQFLMILFSEASINWKIGSIEVMYPFFSWDWASKLFIYPAISTIALRFTGIIYQIIDSGIRATASPITAFFDKISFSTHIEIRQKINQYEKNVENLNIQITSLIESIENAKERQRQQDIEKENTKKLFEKEFKIYLREKTIKTLSLKRIKTEQHKIDDISAHLAMEITKQIPKTIYTFQELTQIIYSVLEDELNKSTTT